MDVVSLCPFRVGAVTWQPRRAAWAITVVCKATYRLLPIESPLADQQEPPVEEDLVPFKGHADVLLVGHAHAHRQEPGRSVVARLAVGAADKSVEISADRIDRVVRLSATVDHLREDERIVLEHLHAEHPRIATALPGVRPRAFHEPRPGATGQSLELTCDTLSIDTDRQICSLLWRLSLPLEHPAQPGRILIGLERRGQRLGWSDIERLISAQIEETDDGSALDAFDFGAPPRPPARPASPSSPAALDDEDPVTAELLARGRGTLVMPDAAASHVRTGPPPRTPAPSAPAMPISAPPARPSAPAAASFAPSPAPSAPAPAFGPPATPSSPSREREVLDLLWYDPTPGAPPEAKDRRAVNAVLTRAAPIDPDALTAALAGAARDDGSFVPPLVLVTGELLFPFDEVEVLKATLTAVTPHLAADHVDRRLQEVVDRARALLASPAAHAAAQLAEELTASLREAFARAHPAPAPGHLDLAIERMLITQRGFQRRAVLGEPSLRALLLPLSGAGTRVPTYVPEAAAARLPLSQRLRARLLAEVHLPQDARDGHPLALRVAAIARMHPLPARR